jgi:insulysin
VLTAERVKQFIPLLLSKMHIECLIHGNITKTEALKVVKILESKLISSVKDLTPLLPKQLVLHREVELPNGKYFI